MATRTQIYLTEEQRSGLDAVRRQEGKTLAEVIREAVEQFLRSRSTDPNAALRETFGVAPEIAIPSRDDWERHG